METAISRARVRGALAVLQIVVALGAIPAGVGLMLDPSGQGLGLQAAWLAESPFDDYVLPGLVLLVVNGLGSGVGAFGCLARREWVGRVGLGLGGFLIVWIVAQIHWIGLSSWLQPTFLAVGGLEVALALRLVGRAAVPSGAKDAAA